MDRFSVIARVRPFSTAEEADHDEEILQYDRQHINLKCGSYSAKKFRLDSIFPPQSTQEEVFEKVLPLLRSSLKGFNSTIFAYGQTGTGKTHTMLGYDLWEMANNPAYPKELPPLSIKKSGDSSLLVHNGIIPRAMDFLFQHVKGNEIPVEGSINVTSVSVSYLEIYNEKLIDLLNEESLAVASTPSTTFAPKIVSKGPTLDIRSKGKDITVTGLLQREVFSLDDVMNALWTGAKNRSIASTNMNEYSSRSHTIFIVTIQTQEIVAGSADDPSPRTEYKKSKISFVDLAGSEKWGNRGIGLDASALSDERIKELTSINKSLSTLGNCVAALISSNGASAHVPYRDSKLTRLLQDSLGGNTRTLFVVTLSCAKSSSDETLSTLQFADRAMRVQIEVTANRVNDDGSGMINYSKLQSVISSYESEISRLRGIISMLLKAGGKGIPDVDLDVVQEAAEDASDGSQSENLYKDINSSLRDELIALSTENANLKKQVVDCKEEISMLKEDADKIIGVMTNSSNSFSLLSINEKDEDARSRQVERFAWIRQYHTWLQSRLMAEYPNISNRASGSLSPEADSTVSASGVGSDDKELWQRIHMIESSVLLQAEELERTKKLYYEQVKALKSEKSEASQLKISSNVSPLRKRADSNPLVTKTATPVKELRTVNPTQKVDKVISARGRESEASDSKRSLVKKVVPTTPRAKSVDKRAPDSSGSVVNGSALRPKPERDAVPSSNTNNFREKPVAAAPKRSSVVSSPAVKSEKALVVESDDVGQSRKPRPSVSRIDSSKEKRIEGLSMQDQLKLANEIFEKHRLAINSYKNDQDRELAGPRSTSTVVTPASTSVEYIEPSITSSVDNEYSTIIEQGVEEPASLPKIDSNCAEGCQSFVMMNDNEINKIETPKRKTIWKEYVDKTSGAPYYYNKQSKETTWDKPPNFPY